MRFTRSLATLRSTPTGPTSSSSLLPPYAHSVASRPAAPPATFLPPYAHSLNPSTPSQSSLAAPYRFKLTQQSATHDVARTEAYDRWATEQLATQEGRETIWRAWVNSIVELEMAKSSGTQIPQVSFQSLHAHLASDSTLAAIRQTGAVVVRDVVADTEARQWAKSVLHTLQARQSRPTFWQESLVAARSNPSVLAANNAILAALTGDEGEAFVQADSVQNGISSSGSRIAISSVEQPWGLGRESLAPSTPLLAHLALTTSHPGSIAPTVSAAIYASLRPLFTPVRSRISFYDETSYLDPANWTLAERTNTSSSSSSEAITFPHLAGAQVGIPRLNAGDMIFRHAAIPISADSSKGEGVFAPVSPLPRTSSNEEYILEQRAAFEKGLPPPHAATGGLVELENSGAEAMIESYGGRRAMGYAP